MLLKHAPAAGGAAPLRWLHSRLQMCTVKTIVWLRHTFLMSLYDMVDDEAKDWTSKKKRIHHHRPYFPARIPINKWSAQDFFSPYLLLCYLLVISLVTSTKVKVARVNKAHFVSIGTSWTLNARTYFQTGPFYVGLKGFAIAFLDVNDMIGKQKIKKRVRNS